MDRFIGSEPSGGESGGGLFKIQYGQIYSNELENISQLYLEFKIQYGQIYRISQNDFVFRYDNLKSNMDRFIAKPQ